MILLWKNGKHSKIKQKNHFEFLKECRFPELRRFLVGFVKWVPEIRRTSNRQFAIIEKKLKGTWVPLLSLGPTGWCNTISPILQMSGL